MGGAGSEEGTSLFVVKTRGVDEHKPVSRMISPEVSAQLPSTALLASQLAAKRRQLHALRRKLHRAKPCHGKALIFVVPATFAH